MPFYSRTDLACEAPRPERGQGVEFREYHREGVRIEEMQVAPGEGETITGRAAGRYATLHCEKLWELEHRELELCAEAAAEVLHSFLTDSLGSAPRSGHGIFVAGLGNRFITADSLGPRTVDLVTVTNHAAGENSILRHLGCCRVCAFAPGVLGQTGLEAAALIAEGATAAGADVILAVDALAARNTARLGTTIQISDTGIHPGAGIANHRSALTKESMGIPVIAIGIPTVVDCATLLWDTLTQSGVDPIPSEWEQALQNGQKYIVSPKECDRIAESAATLLSGAINRVLTPALL